MFKKKFAMYVPNASPGTQKKILVAALGSEKDMVLNSADDNGLNKTACFTVTWVSGAGVHGSQYRPRIPLLRMHSGY
jgi:hypothetical protein